MASWPCRRRWAKCVVPLQEPLRFYMYARTSHKHLPDSRVDKSFSFGYVRWHFWIFSKRGHYFNTIFWMKSYIYVVKTCNILGIKGNLMNLIKAIYPELQITSYLMVKDWKTKNRNKTRMSVLTTAVQHCTRGSRQARKWNKWHPDWNGRVKHLYLLIIYSCV